MDTATKPKPSVDELLQQQLVQATIQTQLLRSISFWVSFLSVALLVVGGLCGFVIVGAVGMIGGGR